MKELAIQQIARAVGAQYSGREDISITAVSTDSRDIRPGCLFIALEGETFDGHEYIAQALENGAACALSMREEASGDSRVLIVRDTRQALLNIARLHREAMSAKIVGITGSVGKTTTRDMTACVLSAAFPTLSTQGNLNNEVGLPQTLLQLTPAHKAAVLEMGMDGPGQIRRLTECARPDVAVITNIGVTHMEHLGSRENIFAAKMEICEGMTGGAALILCGDDDLLTSVRAERFRVIRYGIANQSADIRAEGIQIDSTGCDFTILYNSQRLPTRVPAIGEHMVLAALAGFAVGVSLGIPPEAAAKALRNFVPTGMRQKVVSHRGFTVVEDCYNASPDSMRAALRTLAAMSCTGKRIAVLADMLELGSLAHSAHYETGRLAGELGVDALLCTGELAEWYREGALEAGLRSARHFADKAALAEALRGMVQPGDIVWLKASRGMRLEEVLEKLYEEGWH